MCVYSDSGREVYYKENFGSICAVDHSWRPVLNISRLHLQIFSRHLTSLSLYLLILYFNLTLKPNSWSIDILRIWGSTSSSVRLWNMAFVKLLFLYTILWRLYDTSMADLFKEDGVLVRYQGETWTVTAIWQMVVLINQPTQPEA